MSLNFTKAGTTGEKAKEGRPMFADTHRRRPVEEVTVTADKHRGGDATKHTHPCFTQMSASRVSGSAVLYGSDFVHHSSIRVSIHRSSLTRDLCTDWHHADLTPMIEVEMSEAQWATFVSSLNIGRGVPTTLRSFGDDHWVPSLPDPVDRSAQFTGEAVQRLKRAVKEIDEAIAEVEAMGLSKVKAKAIIDKLTASKQEMTSNLGFVADQFGKHVEKTTEKAKAEIHGYMAGAIQRAGVAALQNAQPPLEIEGPTE